MNRFAEYQSEADAITRSPMNTQSRARLQFLLSSMATMREFGMDKEIASHDPLAFRKQFLKSLENRTYVPMNETDQSAIIPTNIEVRLLQRMLDFGPFVAGSTIMTSLPATKMQSTRIAVSDDREDGQIIDENTTPANDTELTGLSVVSVGGQSKLFSSGIQLASKSLVSDAQSNSWTGFEDLLVKTVGSGRIGKVQNSTLYSALKTSLAANSSAAVAAAGASLAAGDIYTLVKSIPAAERRNAIFVVSEETQAAIAGFKTSSGGGREFPNALEANPTVLGYPLYVQHSAASTDTLFGDFSWMVCKYEPLSVLVMKERFSAQGFYGYIVGQRAEAKWTQSSSSNSSAKYLTFA